MPPRVDFYLSEVAGVEARVRLACRIAEKAYLAKQRVVVFSDDAALLSKVDDLLWTFVRTLSNRLRNTNDKMTFLAVTNRF